MGVAGCPGIPGRIKSVWVAGCYRYRWPDDPGIRNYTRKDRGEHQVTRTYDHELLCTELTSKRMLPYISAIKARDVTEFDSWVRHSGKEFMYVLSCELTLYTEHYRSLSMKAGDSVYYDSSMGHGCVSTSVEDAKVLWVSLEI